MKFMLTASSISSIAISRMMTFLRLRKIPTMLIANSTAPRIRKCDSDSKSFLPWVSRIEDFDPHSLILLLFRRHRNQSHAFAAFHDDLLRRVLVLGVLAFPQRERDRDDDRHQEQHRRELERIRVVGIEQAPERLGVAVAGAGIGGRARLDKTLDDDR